MRHRHARAGYILIETTVAIVVLGISAITIHGVVRQAILTRGQVQDYTQVRLLMEEFLTEKELQPLVFVEQGEGVFQDGSGRFGYTYSITPVPVPRPQFPPRIATNGEPLKTFRYIDGASRLIRISITTYWSRGQLPFEETMEVLLPEDKLYVPQRERQAA
ncbi:MAG: type II secretion system protein [Candidatus Hydrogenedentota bacterium]